MKTTERVIILLSYFLFFVGYPIIKPYKLWLDWSFKRRKAKAIKEADIMRDFARQDIHVVQFGRTFKVGDRKELRRYNKRGTKVVKFSTKKLPINAVTFDYKSAIIYTAYAKDYRR